MKKIKDHYIKILGLYFFGIFTMGLNCLRSRRRGMTISVMILGGFLFITFIAYLAFGETNVENRSLRMATIIFRHGDRTPTETYPTDPNINYIWPGGLGALTEKGSLEMYNLGKHLRQRYYRLIPENGFYTKEKMFVFSSYAERCLMSAQSFLAGFLPPLENKNRLPIQWQPVPINSLPRSNDHLMAQKKTCPKYDKLLHKMYNDPPEYLKTLYDSNKYIFDYLTKYAGKNILNINDLEYFYNTLSIHKDNGLILPKWTEEVFPDKMYPLAVRNYLVLTETPFMKQIKAGPLLTEIMDNMEKKREGKLNPDRSLFIFSGHDVTLMNIMNALDIVSQTSSKPDYGATLVFELHQSVNFTDDLEVKIVYYFDTEDRIPKEISIPNCNSPCPLTNFIKSLAHLVVRDYDELCKI